MTDTSADLVILGGGSGGYAAAFRAAELGLSVTLIEKDKLGGTCLHRGCIPTKALLHAAEVADETREAEAVGVKAVFEGIDIAGVNKYKDGIVARLYKGLQGLAKAHKVNLVEGSGTFVGGTTVEVDGTRYTGKNVILATGSYSRTLPGLELGGRVIASEQALALDYVPKKVVVLGGGVIGVEFASVWASFGVDVTIVEALPRLVPNEDEFASKQLERAFRRRKIAFKTGVKFTGAKQDDNGVSVSLESGETIDADLLLVAVGRGPNSAGHGYEEAGVKIERGFVLTDERLRTNLPNVYAVGDIVPGPAARAPRLPAGHLRRRGDRRAEPARDRRERHPASHLLPPRGRVGRADRVAGEGEVRLRRHDLHLRPRRQRQEPDPQDLRRGQAGQGPGRPGRRASTWSATASAS